MKFLVLAVICIAASTEAYSSGYSSGSASASTFASGYASGGAAAASASAAAPANVKHYLEAEVKLTGMSAAEFNTQENKNNFAKALADGISDVVWTDIYDITAVNARRTKAVKVSFKIKVASAGATTLNTYLKKSGTGGFLSTLKAKSTVFNAVTAIAVTKAPAAKTTTTVSSVSKSAVVSLTSVLACAFLALRQ